ncbi:translation initiation factor IF-2-like [Cervus elaphus]|uniref:translation initiation factor IF-2-like n=1 Tax=Cervus elaphus TaxID=9860 RepID=UPI001CC31262|nr:translation initiation factor IF-2-like [Cervus elaphus]
MVSAPCISQTLLSLSLSRPLLAFPCVLQREAYFARMRRAHQNRTSLSEEQLRAAITTGRIPGPPQGKGRAQRFSQVDEAQRRMDAEIWQLLSSFAAQPPAPPQRLSPHPQPAAALQAAPPSSPSSSFPSSSSPSSPSSSFPSSSPSSFSPSSSSPSFSPSSSAFSASLSSAAGAQVCAESPTKGPLPQAPRFQLSLNQRHKFCPFLHPTWTDIYSHFFFLYTKPVPAHLC